MTLSEVTYWWRPLGGRYLGLSWVDRLLEYEAETVEIQACLVLIARGILHALSNCSIHSSESPIKGIYVIDPKSARFT